MVNSKDVRSKETHLIIIGQFFGPEPDNIIMIYLYLVQLLVLSKSLFISDIKIYTAVYWKLSTERIHKEAVQQQTWSFIYVSII